jgi:hypothetical protein
VPGGSQVDHALQGSVTVFVHKRTRSHLGNTAVPSGTQRYTAVHSGTAPAAPSGATPR